VKIEEINPPKPREFVLEVTEDELKVIRFAIGAMSEAKNPGNHGVFVGLMDISLCEYGFMCGRPATTTRQLPSGLRQRSVCDRHAQILDRLKANIA